jgi:hypothetical protein
MSAERVRIEMELVVGSEPIRGTLDEGDAGRRPFLGWIELAARIEAARLTTLQREEHV